MCSQLARQDRGIIGYCAPQSRSKCSSSSCRPAALRSNTSCCKRLVSGTARSLGAMSRAAPAALPPLIEDAEAIVVRVQDAPADGRIERPAHNSTLRLTRTIALVRGPDAQAAERHHARINRPGLPSRPRPARRNHSRRARIGFDRRTASPVSCLRPAVGLARGVSASRRSQGAARRRPGLLRLAPAHTTADGRLSPSNASCTIRASFSISGARR